MGKRVELEAIYSSVVNFAMQQNYVPIIKKLIIKNITNQDINDANITITTEPEYAYEWTIKVEVIPALQAVEIDSINMKLSPKLLYSLTERMAGTIFIKIKQEEEVLIDVVENIDILAYDEWSGILIMPEIVAAFITPNHQKITEVIMKANKILGKWCGSPAFTGYQSNNPNIVKMQMAAIYAALQNENIAYCMPPASYEIVGQRVRLLDSVFTQKMGTCLDLSLVYAGCLEAVGLNPIIIFLKGHALVGCWLENQCFAECVQDDISLITKRIADGINEICLVETTCFVACKLIGFDDAVKIGEKNLTLNDFELMVDIKRTRGSAIRPIPLRSDIHNEIGVWEDFGESDNQKCNRTDDINSPREIETFEKINYVDHIDATRQQIWERKLLDLSLRNTLLNFRVTKTTIQLMVNHLGELEDELASGQEFQIMAKPKDFENTIRDSKIFGIENDISLVDSLVRTEFVNKRIRTFIEEADVAYRITSLYRQAKVSLEENGTNTLYLALGFLKWYESDVSEKERLAPIILIPIDIVRKSAQKGYIIRVRDEETQMNITLLEMLRQDFGISIGGLDPLPTDQSGIDLKRVFNIVRQAVMEKSRWDVVELAFIGLFSFSQFIMWNDIRNRCEDLKKNKIVRSLMSGKMEWEVQEDFPDSDKLDEIFTPIDVAVPISADSSQLSAICAAGKGHSFVLHGPPGTGKSQTITNIIANAMFQGKSVLFIAEKMAALSVVQKRLASLGLGPFCLELHSNKAKKKDVLGQLEEGLAIGKISSPTEYKDKAERLHVLRKELNAVVEAIHKKHQFGFSLYEAITMFEQYKGYSDCLKFSREQVEKVTPQIYEQWIDTVNELRVAGKECKGAYNNPLAEFTNLNYSQGLKSEIGEDLASYIVTIGDLKILISKLCKIIGLNAIGSHKKVEAIMNLSIVLENIKYMPPKLFESGELDLLKEKVQKVCECGKKRDELEERLLNLFSREILTFNEVAAMNQWKTAEASWFLPKMLGQNKITKSIKVIANNPKQINKKDVLSYIELVAEYKSNLKVIDENNSLFGELFGLIWDSGRTDWDLIAKVYSQAVLANQLLRVIGSNNAEIQDLKTKLQDVFSDLGSFKQHNESVLKECTATWDRRSALQTSLSQKCGIDFAKLEQDGDWLNSILQKVKTWKDNLGGLRNWSTYLNVKAKADGIGINNVVIAYEAGLINENNLLPCFYYNVARDFAINIVDNEKCLADFNGAIFEESISKYKQTCSEFETLTKNELLARLSARVPRTSENIVNSSEVGILQKAIRSGGRMMSIRKLFDSIPNLLRKLCPCMLMSPISVAQYIDPKYPPFDLVVFDEASQMPTCEAVGAMARGNNVIVVGDPKQLPPTSFFNANRVDEDNFEKEDLESILDDCLALSMPQQHLLWHYRSRHESLIAFSNMQYYDNKLFTFPSPRDLVSAVRYIPVEGYYDRGKTKHNRAEADAIVAEILRRLEDPILSKQSIGVVTFSSVQQNLIDDILVEAFAKNPELEKVNNEVYEPIFIKNLENVQGDERDVILFSIGYGPDEAGKVALNFGPLNREGGWRRLNVAVSRARKEMMVFSTLRPEQIDLSKTRSTGIAGLKAFLEFAKQGKSGLPVKVSSVSTDESAIEKMIAEKINALGYEVHTNIGCSKYKIDIAIVDKENKGEYILGIMCDGIKYKSAGTARDRNILQQNVLMSLGWNIHRLWILDWWENADNELTKIKAAIENDIQNKGKEPCIEAIKSSNVQICDPAQYKKQGYDENKASGKSVDASVDEPIDRLVDENVKYVLCSLEKVTLGTDEFYLTKNNKLIISQLEQILEIEAPISKNLICKRILSAWGISRMGARLERRFDELFEVMGLIKTERSNEIFYWNKQQNPLEYTLFRVPTDDVTRRNIEDIPLEEIANAVKYILENQVSLLRGDLIKEVYKLFGFSRGNSVIEEAVGEGICVAVKNGDVRVEGDRLVSMA